MHLCYTHTNTCEATRIFPCLSEQSSGVHNFRGRHPQCQAHLPMHWGGTVLDLISYLLHSFFKTPALFLHKPFYLIFSSPGLCALDPCRGDSLHHSYHAFAGRPSPTLQYKVHFLPRNFNITLPLVFTVLTSSESSYIVCLIPVIFLIHFMRAGTWPNLFLIVFPKSRIMPGTFSNKYILNK